jgi:hypothetical protein
MKPIDLPVRFFPPADDRFSYQSDDTYRRNHILDFRARA